MILLSSTNDSLRNVVISLADDFALARSALSTTASILSILFAVVIIAFLKTSAE